MVENTHFESGRDDRGEFVRVTLPDGHQFVIDIQDRDHLNHRSLITLHALGRAAAQSIFTDKLWDFPKD